MGLFDWIKGVTFLEVIEWTDPSRDTLIFRFPTYDKMIKWGAQLTVRESQVAIFISEGRMADMFQPGRYTLSTKNIPILVGLLGIPFGAETPFKAEVYFINTREFTNLKWGTPNPIMMNSSDFGPIRARAFGTYTLKVGDAVKLLKNVVGTDGHFTVDEIMDQLRSHIIQQFADTLGEAKIPMLDLASQYNELSARVGERARVEFNEYGLMLPRMVIENITLPEEVEKALDERGKMAAIGDLDRFTRLKAAEAMKEAAKNPGTAGESLGIGAGFVLAQQMARNLNQPLPPPPAPALAAVPMAAAAPAASAATVVCPSCTKPTPPGKFCIECGKPLPAKANCPGCQQEVPSGSKFCPHCGAKLP